MTNNRNKPQAEIFRSLYGSNVPIRFLPEQTLPNKWVDVAPDGTICTGSLQGVTKEQVDRAVEVATEVEQPSLQMEDAARQYKNAMFGIHFGSTFRSGGFKRGEMVNLYARSTQPARPCVIDTDHDAAQADTKVLRGMSQPCMSISDGPDFFDEADIAMTQAQARALALAVDIQTRTLTDGVALTDLATGVAVDPIGLYQPNPALRRKLENVEPAYTTTVTGRITEANLEHIKFRLQNPMEAWALRAGQGQSRAGRQPVPVIIIDSLPNFERKFLVDPKTNADIVSREERYDESMQAKHEAMKAHERSVSTTKPGGNNKAHTSKAARKSRIKAAKASRKRNR